MISLPVLCINNKIHTLIDKELVYSRKITSIIQSKIITHDVISLNFKVLRTKIFYLTHVKFDKS